MTSPASDGTMSGGRRRIDKVLADDFAVDLEGLDITDLRERLLVLEERVHPARPIRVRAVPPDDDREVLDGHALA